MDNYYVSDENLVKQDTDNIGKYVGYIIILPILFLCRYQNSKCIYFLKFSDSKDIYIIEGPFEAYDNNLNQDESLQLETNNFEESRNCFELLLFT